MTAAASFGVEYLARTRLPPPSDSWWDRVLGLAHFGALPIATPRGRIPIVEVRMTPLATADGVCEAWLTDGPLTDGSVGEVRYRASGQLLYGCISVHENPQRTLELATAQAYDGIFSALDVLGFPRLARIWNYVPAINADAVDGERYWQFNKARQESFLARRRPVVDGVPAGSALGTPTGSPLVVYFLATRAALRAIENPRQVSAYHYPLQYGPRSPTFSRAALLAEPAGGALLVSGTASIVGHRSMHADDVAAQTRETLANIDVLIAEANRLSSNSQYAAEGLAYKVYVRHPDHLPAIADELCAALGDAAAVTYLHADVCRRDLLVEIEAASCGMIASH